MAEWKSRAVRGGLVEPSVVQRCSARTLSVVESFVMISASDSGSVVLGLDSWKAPRTTRSVFFFFALAGGLSTDGLPCLRPGLDDWVWRFEQTRGQITVLARSRNTRPSRRRPTENISNTKPQVTGLQG